MAEDVPGLCDGAKRRPSSPVTILNFLLSHRLPLLLLTISASWPVLRWYYLRLTDGSDEPCGILALLLALAFIPYRQLHHPLPRHRHLLHLALLALYTASFHFIPPLARALLFVSQLSLLTTPRLNLAWTSLLALSLPLISTLQFYLGYPLRWLTTQLCVPLLNLFGLHVRADATTLLWRGERVIVDAPCSGIQMLWTTLVLASALALWRKLDNHRTLRLAQLAATAIFLANTLRCALLFCTESNLLPNPSWAHETIGLTLFALVAAYLFHKSQKLSRQSPAPGISSQQKPRHHSNSLFPILYSLLFATALAVPLLPQQSSNTTGTSSAQNFTGWPPIPPDWSPLPLGPRELRFAQNFPGQTAAFTAPDRTIILRWLPAPTRQLHPATACLRALGFTIEPRPIRIKPDGTRWSAHTATRANERLLVLERIFTPTHQSWTDISNWYWSATLKKNSGTPTYFFQTELIPID